MLIALAALEGLTLLLVLALLLRKQAPAVDPGQMLRLETKTDALETALRNGFSDARREAQETTLRTLEANAKAASELRTEVTDSISKLSTVLTGGLDSFRADNKSSAVDLQKAMNLQMDFLQNRLGQFAEAQHQQATTLRESLNSKLNDLSTSNTQHLDKLNRDNAAKLEEMRQTVDEKLHATLQTRLTESFGQVTDQLTKVHAGLGEMSKLSEGVDDLSRIFTNVKSRGGFAEVQLGMLLEQMLAPSQYLQNARVKANSLEVVEYAVRFPSPQGETLLPIDAKFPREDWERLEAAYERGNPEEVHTAGRAFEAAIRTEGKRICDKYIQPPVTTPHAIMFLPTEGLYAEVMRRDGLQAEIQSRCNVTIAGPSTLSAILTSFQMGFRMLAIQEKGDDVWKVLSKTRSEFSKFGDLMSKMEKQVSTVQNTIESLNVRTRAINRTLREVEMDAGNPGDGDEIPFPELGNMAPLLAASEEEPF
ncbi:DNA recombination protein RmuC [Terriglobus albidus]|uniref:DNA recombination protein RmuC n=1 Tax=Terriglobus albidus TaxID=1592106 RepID=A0A5B9EAC4_9BACT|nr:DNA recombination protein RmuC [Terriglobus albidus]QEE27381.1 DNA recombination protein RmuC [Terriglobus albidus]